MNWHLVHFIFDYYSTLDLHYIDGLSTYHLQSASGKRVIVTELNVERNVDHPTWEDTVYLKWEPEKIMVLYL